MFSACVTEDHLASSWENRANRLQTSEANLAINLISVEKPRKNCCWCFDPNLLLENVSSTKDKKAPVGSDARTSWLSEPFLHWWLLKIFISSSRSLCLGMKPHLNNLFRVFPLRSHTKPGHLRLNRTPPECWSVSLHALCP